MDTPLIDVLASEDKRIQRWERRNAATPRLTSWATPSRTKLLITLMPILMLTGLTLIFIGLHQSKHAALYLGTISWALSMVPWTMLRITIQAKDTAPLAVLDELEQSVLDRGRRLALGVALWLLSIGGFGAFIAAIFIENFPAPAIICIIAGEYMLISAMIASMLPAIVFALAFNKPVEED